MVADKIHQPALEIFQLATDLSQLIEIGVQLIDRHIQVLLNPFMLFAGGGFRHGQHLAFDTERNYPLPNLFVSMLQRMGIESDSFATSTGTMRGLDVA